MRRVFCQLSKIFATKKVASSEESRLVENRLNDSSVLLII